MSESALFFISTEHATHRDDTISRFTINIGNTIYVDKATSVVPTSISLPNIFPNVTLHKNSWLEDPAGALSIPVNQYTLTELLVALNASGSGITWSETDGFIVMTTAVTTLITAGTEFWGMLGFSSSQYNANGEISATAVSPLTAAHKPNLGGEAVIFITCDKIAPGNMVHAKDGTPYDVLAVLSLHDTPHGQVTHFRSDDIRMSDIEYKGHNQFDTLIVGIWDSQMRSLPFAENHHLRMTLKVFHADNQRGMQPRARG